MDQSIGSNPQHDYIPPLILPLGTKKLASFVNNISNDSEDIQGTISGSKITNEEPIVVTSLKVLYQKVIFKPNFDKNYLEGFVKIQLESLLSTISNIKLCIGSLHIVSIHAIYDDSMDITISHSSLGYDDPINWINKVYDMIPIRFEKAEHIISENRPLSSCVDINLPYAVKKGQNISFHIAFEAHHDQIESMHFDTNGNIFVYNKEHSICFPCISESTNYDIHSISRFDLSVLIDDITQLHVITGLFPKEKQKLSQYSLFPFTSNDIRSFYPLDFAMAIGRFSTLSLPIGSHPSGVYFDATSSNEFTEAIQNTIEHVNKALEFYNWLMQIEYPHPSFSIIILPNPPIFEHVILNRLGILFINMSLVYDIKIVDQAYHTRHELFRSIALQYFWFSLQLDHGSDMWLPIGLSMYSSDLFLIKLLGETHIKARLLRDMDQVCQLDSNQLPLSPTRYCPQYLSFLDTQLTEFRKTKSSLVFHMIESKLGRPAMFKLLNSIHQATSDDQIATISTNGFLKLVKKLTGKDLKEFADQWIFQGGSSHFICSFTLSNRKPILECTIRQISTRHVDSIEQDVNTDNVDSRIFVGPLKIRVYETDGIYDHSVRIQEALHKFELPIHAKVRRSASKKQDKSAASTIQDDPNILQSQSTKIESTVQWIRIDPDMEWIRTIDLKQLDDDAWINQVENDTDVVSQIESILAISRLSNEKAVLALDHVLSNTKMYYQVRYLAAHAMVRMIPYSMNLRSNVTHTLLLYYENNYCLPKSSANDYSTAKANDWGNNLSDYFVQKAIPESLSLIRHEETGCAPLEVTRLLLHILKLNDNTFNKYSDYGLVASVISSLVNALSPICKIPQKNQDTIMINDSSHLLLPTDSGLNTNILKDAIDELERYRFIDMIEPSYHNSITVSIIQSSGKLAVAGLASVNMDMLLQYSQPGNFIDVRLAAIETLFLLFPMKSQQYDMKNSIKVLFNMLLNDESILFKKCFLYIIHQQSIVSTSFTEILRENNQIIHVIKLLLQKHLAYGSYSFINLLLSISRTILNDSNSIVMDD